MNKKKIFYAIGVVIGIAIIIAGIIVMSSSPESYSTDRISDYSFGADYYTEQYNATRITGNNVGLTASNIRELGQSLAKYIGVGYLILGVLVCYKNVRSFALSNDSDAAQTAAAAPASFETPAASTAPPSITAVSENTSPEAVEAPKAPQAETLSENEWKCPKCGRINQSYVGTCGCGELKPQ